MLHIRTSNQIVRGLNRKLPKTRTGSKAITTEDPNTLNTNRPMKMDAHGIAGTQCLVTLALGALGAAVTITIWVWDDLAAMWLHLGADSTEYTKSFDSKTISGFNIAEKRNFYLQGSAAVDDAWVDCEACPGSIYG